MKKMCIGDKLQIQCYKHNGKVHRVWDEAIVLDIKKDYMVFGNNRTLVTEAEGNAWKTKEPAILYYFKNEWFNIICQLKQDGVYYYCNIASPFIIEDDTIKYIDYDLDLRVFPTGEYKILDRLEYKRHQKMMGYSKELSTVVENALDELITLYTSNSNFFSTEENEKYYELFMELKKEEN